MILAPAKSAMSWDLLIYKATLLAVVDLQYTLSYCTVVSLFTCMHHAMIVPIIRGLPIIGSTDISATDRVIFTTSVIGTTITQPADINTDYSACEIHFI